MNNLLTAIMTKLSGTAVWTDVAGRIYLDRAPDETPFPYIVFSIVSETPEKTFTEDYKTVDVQFSLYSTSKSVSEIAAMDTDLETALDEKSLTITGSTLVWMRRKHLETMIDDVTTPTGTFSIKHWAVDYEVLISKN